jgi:glycosyltransferase involved in cell wall biosynthesis
MLVVWARRIGLFIMSDGEVQLSAVVTTLNNADTLEKCLASLKFCDEIIVLDSGSSDATQAIANRYTAKLSVESFKGYGLQKQSAMDKACGKWILLLDADEYLAADAEKIIRSAISDSIYQGYRLPRHEWLMWRWPHPWTRPNWQLRLFMKSVGAMNAVPVHAAPEVTGKVSNLQLGFYHLGEKNLAHRVSKINAYSTGMLEKKLSKSFIALRVLLYPSFVFFRFYVLKRYFLNGWAGYLAARTQAFYAFLKYAKRLEAARIEKTTIEK